MDRKIEETDASRRSVLLGALAAACSVLIPAGLPGCSKEESVPVPAPDRPSAPSTAVAAPPPAVAKVGKASVQYQTQPKGEQKCAGCVHFIPESNTCKLVEGDISPNGWCLLWAKKT